MAEKILVTGATGLVGSALVKELNKRNKKEVRAAFHRGRVTPQLKTFSSEQIRLEFGDFSTIDRAFQGVSTLFLVTPFAREQVEYAKRMIDRALLFGIEHIVDLSILGAEQEPGTQFSRWHRRIEKYLENCGAAYTIIRPNIFMQNFLRYAQPSGGFIYLPLNHARVSYIDVNDIAAVAAEIIIAGKEHYGAIYELTGPQALTVDDVTHIISSSVGIHVGYIPIQEETACHIMESLGIPAWMAKGMLELYSMQREGKNEMVTSTVELLCNRKPISFEEFVFNNSSLFKEIIQHEQQTYPH